MICLIILHFFNIDFGCFYCKLEKRRILFILNIASGIYKTLSALTFLNLQ